MAAPPSLPLLHWDLLLRVLELSDAPALAVLGSVSFDFLVASSDLLYKDVVVRSVAAMEGLFCERKRKKTRWWKRSKPQPSRINPYLSLSQIQNLHVDITSIGSIHSFPTLSLFFSRTEHPGPLLLRTFTLTFNFWIGFRALFTSLLLNINPSRVKYEGWSRSTHTHSFLLFPLPDEHQHRVLDNWTRIEVVEIKAEHAHVGIDAGTTPIAQLPPPSQGRRRELRLDLSILAEHGSFPKWLKEFEGMAYGFSHESRREGSVVLVVETEEKRVVVENAVGGLDEEYRRLFVVKLEE